MSIAWSQRGAVLITIVILLLIMTVGAALLSTLATTGARVGGDQSQSVQAIYHAESGLEWAARELQRRVQEEGEEYETACNALDGYDDPDGRYHIEVRDQGGSAQDCNLEILGAVPDLSNALAQRRLRARVNRQAVEGGEQNVVGGEDNFANACSGAHRTCNDDGSVTFSSPSGKDSLNRSGATEELVDDDAFGPGDEVFLFLRFSDELQSISDFGLDNVPDNGDRSWQSHPASSLPDGFSAGLSLGSGFTPAELNDQENLRFNIEWDGDAITVEASCIGTVSTCEGTDNDPSEQWGEE